MKLKRYGIFLLALSVLLPLSFYLSQTWAKENGRKTTELQRAHAAKIAKIQIDNSASSNKAGDKVPPAKTGNRLNETNQENASPDRPEKTAVTEAPLETKKVQKDFLVVIDPGHQSRANTEQEPIGPGAAETKIKVTGGTSGVATGKPEYKLTLEASVVLGQLLESKGAKVVYTRTTDNVNLSNQERAAIANQNHADLFVRIHADGSTDRNVHGLSVLTPASNDPYTKGIFGDSLKASQFIINEISKNSAVKVNGISYRSDMAGFNWSKVPCTLVELGFMTNPAEDKELSDPVYLKNLLTNIADGIMQYANYKL